MTPMTPEEVAAQMQAIREQILNRKPVTDDPSLSDEAFLEATRQDRTANAQSQVAALIHSAAARKNIAPLPVQSQSDILLRRRAMRNDDLPALQAKKAVLDDMFKDQFAKDPNSVALGKWMLRETFGEEMPDLPGIQDTRQFDVLEPIIKTAGTSANLGFQAYTRANEANAARAAAATEAENRRAFEREQKETEATRQAGRDMAQQKFQAFLERMRQTGLNSRQDKALQAEMEKRAAEKAEPGWREKSAFESEVHRWTKDAPKGLTTAMKILDDAQDIIDSAGGLENMTGFGIKGNWLPDITVPERSKNVRQSLRELNNAILKATSGTAVSWPEYQRFDKARRGGGTEHELQYGLFLLRDSLDAAFKQSIAAARPEVQERAAKILPPKSKERWDKQKEKVPVDPNKPAPANATQVPDKAPVRVKHIASGVEDVYPAAVAGEMLKQLDAKGQRIFQVVE